MIDQLYHVYRERADRYEHVIVMARNREDAKRQANGYFHSDPNAYVVNPLSHPGETVYLHIRVGPSDLERVRARQEG